MRLTVLGSAAAWQERPGCPSSSYLVEHAGEAIVLDLGQGAFGELCAHRAPSSVRAVVISHLHADHHVDLVPLRHYLRYAFDEPRTIALHVPDELRRRYDIFCGEDRFLADMPGPSLTAGSREVGPFVVEAHPVLHSEHSYAFRVTTQDDPAGPGLVYSGDCGRADDLLPLIREGDTLLCEAYWSNRTPQPGAHHLTAEQAAGAARRGGAANLILTHILESHDPQAALGTARQAFGGDVSLAVPGGIAHIGARS